MPARIHPTALVEDNVTIGEGTSVWDNVHIRHDSRIGEECIIGEKTYVAYGVEIGDRVKINAMVYICNAVTIEDGVMISAGTIFTNDRFPRATTPDLSKLRSSDPDEHTLPTLVREGATIGAAATISNDRPFRDGRHGLGRDEIRAGLSSCAWLTGKVHRLRLPPTHCEIPKRHPGENCQEQYSFS